MDNRQRAVFVRDIHEDATASPDARTRIGTAVVQNDGEITVYLNRLPRQGAFARLYVARDDEPRR